MQHVRGYLHSVAGAMQLKDQDAVKSDFGAYRRRVIVFSTSSCDNQPCSVTCCVLEHPIRSSFHQGSRCHPRILSTLHRGQNWSNKS